MREGRAGWLCLFPQNGKVILIVMDAISVRGFYGLLSNKVKVFLVFVMCMLQIIIEKY